MVTAKVIEEKPLSLSDVREILSAIEKRDKELNQFSNRVKEYLESFVAISSKRAEELRKKLQGLQLTRLKEEHIAKILDFLPKKTNDLKIVLQAYPLSMPKKDQDEIVKVVNETV